MIKEALKTHQNDENAPRISLSLLGTPQLNVDSQIVRLPYLKAEALLYYLAVTGQPQSRATLATLLWSKSPEKQARNSLRNAIYAIRKGLQQTNCLLVERDIICLAMKLVQLDVTQFQTIIEHPPGTTALANALALWQGPFLNNLHLPDTPTFEEWLAERRLYYETLYRQGLFHLGQRYTAENRLPEARQTIEKLLAIDPLNETGHQQLMRLYVQSGNRAAALRQYETLRLLLREELGINPDPSVQALHMELLQADDAPSPPILLQNIDKPIGRYRFVGRRREMARLSEIYQSRRPNGPACLVMLEGEPGIGKTRMAREWLAALAQANILTTRCFEADRSIPFQPWIDLIRTTLKQTALSQTALSQTALSQTPLPQLGLPDVWLTELAHLVPEIRLQRPDLELTSVPDPELARGRIIQAIYHWLETLCQQGSLCIFIDDWQWIDQASLTLLRYILRPQQSSRLPLFILGAQRETETMPGWASLQSSLARDNVLHQIKLYRLSLSEVAILAQSMALPDTVQTDAFFKRLLAETEGNALFITEFLQTLTLENLKTDDWPVPHTIQTVIQNRLAHLSDAACQMLTAAAVIGRIFTDTMLQQISNLPLETILAALDEAVAAHLIAEQANAYDFTHDKIRAVLLDGLTQSHRRHYHLQIAATLEATLSNDFGLLSYHFEMGNDTLRARNYGLQAARQTVELYADEDALRWYEKVERLTENTIAELSPAAIPKVTPFQQTHVSRGSPLDVLGLVYRQRGQIQQRIGQYDGAERSFSLALERGKARERLDEQAAAHNLLSFLAYLRSDYDGVGRHAQRALDLAAKTGEPALRAPGLRHLGISVYRTGDYVRARQLYDESLAAYRAVGDKLGMATVYNNIGFVLRTQHRYAESIAAFQEALNIYEAIGQVEGIALICSNIGRTYAFSGDLAQAQQYLGRGLALSTESHTDWITVKIHRTMGNVFAKNEQWPQALFHAQQAQTLATALGSHEDLGATLRLLAEIAIAWPSGNLDNPATYYQQSIALLKQVGAQDELERTEESFAAFSNQVAG